MKKIYIIPIPIIILIWDVGSNEGGAGRKGRTILVEDPVRSIMGLLWVCFLSGPMIYFKSNLKTSLTVKVHR